MGTVRIRVAFEDRHMLSRSQKSEGLKRSWILLDPQHQTISDISSYLIHAFQLSHRCPNGVKLSMNGFVLPPFESVDILKDRDEISVKKKSCKLSNIIRGSEDEGQLMILDKDIVDIAAIPLLTNKEFSKEAGGYESHIVEEDNEVVDVLPLESPSPVKDKILKKRKADKSVQSASKKRKKCKMITEESEINVSKKDNKDCENNKIQLGTNVSKEENIPPTSENELICVQSPKDKLSKRTKSDKHPVGNGAVTKKSDDIPTSTQKVPSRSARRKKAKRIWRREFLKKEMEKLKLPQNEEKSPQNGNQKNPIECQSLETDEQMIPIELQSLETDEQMNPSECQSPQKDNHKNSIEFQSLKTDEQMNPTESQSLEKVKQKNPNTDDDIIPIVIRPGHIRFEPLEKDHTVPENQLPMETFQWNGITSKKQGQKWGKEKLSAKRVDSKDISNEYSGRAAKEKETLMEEGPINFEKLAPISTVPQDGDLIAYRLVELSSSSWTPEVSSFRVGKVASFDYQSNVILLTPVPEYPIVEKKANEEEDEEEGEDVSEQPDNISLYKEDGSLEIAFSSLIDVRVVKPANQDPTKAVKIAKATNVVISDKKEGSVWDEMNDALRAKKKQLLEKNDWDTKTAGKASWSYRALRGSALGPAMAYLRARNDI